jgi:hypothetical protein
MAHGGELMKSVRLILPAGLVAWTLLLPADLALAQAAERLPEACALAPVSRGSGSPAMRSRPPAAAALDRQPPALGNAWSVDSLRASPEARRPWDISLSPTAGQPRGRISPGHCVGGGPTVRLIADSTVGSDGALAARQLEHEGRALAGSTTHRDPTAVGRDDAAGDPQA